MDQGTNPIEEHIENTRRELGSNLDEIQERIEAATDWRYQYRQRPLTFLGLTLAGGMLLGRTMRQRR